MKVFKVNGLLFEDSAYTRMLVANAKAEMLDKVIKKLAESEDTILSDKQYYTLMELKEQK